VLPGQRLIAAAMCPVRGERVVLSHAHHESHPQLPLQPAGSPGHRPGPPHGFGPPHPPAREGRVRPPAPPLTRTTGPRPPDRTTGQGAVPVPGSGGPPARPSFPAAT